MKIFAEGEDFVFDFGLLVSAALLESPEPTRFQQLLGKEIAPTMDATPTRRAVDRPLKKS